MSKQDAASCLDVVAELRGLLVESDDAPALLILVAAGGGGLLVLHRHPVDVVVHAVDAAWRGETIDSLRVRLLTD